MNQTKQEIREQGENFDRVKTQLRRDVISHYGEEKSLTVWNQIDHLKPIYILDHFPGLKATLSPERIKELQEISDVRTAKDVATIKKELPTRQYNFYRDPGHAWLSVTRQELIDFHIDRIISKHSYQKGNLVYLEEDSDANLFLNKAISQAKFNLELIDKHSDKDSIIRTYEPYSPDPDLEIAKCQDCKHEFFAKPEELEGYVCPSCFIARENKRIDLLRKTTASTQEMKDKIQARRTRNQRNPMIPLDQMRGYLIKLAKAPRNDISINTEISLWYVIGMLDFMLETKKQSIKERKPLSPDQKLSILKEQVVK